MLRPVPVADPAAEIAAWWRLVELCLPTHEKCGALTFAPSGTETLDGDWERWVTDVFLPVLHPALLSLQNAAAAQDNVRLLCEDAALGAALTADAAQRCSLPANLPKGPSFSSACAKRLCIAPKPDNSPRSSPSVARFSICPSCK